MANYTQKAILNTFEEMLEQMPFDKITVTAIVAKCEISSNTFYYHFRDIYDLLDAWLDKEKAFLLKQTAGLKNWADILKVVLHTLQENPRLVYHVSDSISRERMERYMFTYVEGQFYDYVKRYTEGANVPEEKLKSISNFFCYALLGYFLKFLWINMEIDVDASVDNLYQIFHSVMENAAHRELPEPTGPERQV